MIWLHFFIIFSFFQKHVINLLLNERDDMSKSEMKKPVLSIKEKRKLKKESDDNQVVKPRKKRKA